MKLKFKSLSLLLAVVLFFGITLTPITASAAMESKPITVYLQSEKFHAFTYSRWNAKRTHYNEIGKVSGWGQGMKTISADNVIYYNADCPTSETTNYIRRTAIDGTYYDYKFVFEAHEVKDNNYLLIKCDSYGRPKCFQFFKTYKELKKKL